MSKANSYNIPEATFVPLSEEDVIKSSQIGGNEDDLPID
jgi:hypothetical protein